MSDFFPTMQCWNGPLLACHCWRYKSWIHCIKSYLISLSIHSTSTMLPLTTAESMTSVSRQVSWPPGRFFRNTDRGLYLWEMIIVVVVLFQLFPKLVNLLLKTGPFLVNLYSIMRHIFLVKSCLLIFELNHGYVILIYIFVHYLWKMKI